ncbi:FAD-dependent oxidoreductase [Solirubrobacter sp. CPCC 204708]|uniref:FAD-dependent oxidoreductase n=1 Tax=Solirubrobacter deserti TaxID=2282478 RepID=A0ABT4RGH8_9ACTN|nr:NAD(P)-binding protein [Solirubrobacter deserti]MBE2319637.1 FAD-dependent oxidoreductase [Solirubrobacter deserti]MDA0137624.1 FAD-dependent oxidoreductase [Solirubrobacter deserti]
METITIVGAGLAGLTAAIACAEAGAPVVLYDAHAEPGGRARSLDAPYRANLGPHVLYSDGELWRWLKERELLPPVAGAPLTGVRLRWDGAIHRTPPLGLIPSVLKLRGRRPPVDESFRSWAASHAGDRAAELLSSLAGVFTFHHDPGELSAAFVWERTGRIASPPPSVRFVIGGWSALVHALVSRARALHVEFRLGERVTELPSTPVIVALEPADARALLDDDSLRWPSGHTVCIDLGLEGRRGDPFVVSDLDECGWIERFSAADKTVAPAGHELVQAQMPVRPGEPIEATTRRLERMLDLAFPDRAARTHWHRRMVMDGRTGALDLPGTTWRDRPALDRGDGTTFIAGDWVAAPGLLGEVAFKSAVEAAALAVSAASVVSLRRAA